MSKTYNKLSLMDIAPGTLQYHSYVYPSGTPLTLVNNFHCRTVESFEVLVSLYAQQIPVNSTQHFNFTSLNLAIERVSLQ